MNIELAKRLVTRFRRMRHRKHFNMENVAIKTDCGTAMCIAGHTLDLCGYKPRWKNGELTGWLGPDGSELSYLNTLNVARKELDLTYKQAQYLDVYTTSDSGLFYRFDLKTPKQAAAVIEKMIAEVNND